MKHYETFCFSDKPDWSLVPEGRIDCFQWESEPPYRPDSVFKICFVKNKGIYVKMATDEKNIRCICTERDEAIWEDSCLEFFFMPFPEGDYFNIEMNPNSAFLSQFGKGREGRIFIKELTDLSPEVKAKVTENGWEVECFVPCSFIEALYKTTFNAEAGEYKGCFFKCGDKTEIPHYGSFVPMGALPPGFHNPEKFATITVRMFD